MFVVCGEALWDLFGVEREGGLIFDARSGGSPFNVAVGLARLGQPSALFTGLSRDSLGQRLHELLEAEGVMTNLLLRSDRPTTLSIVDLGLEGGPAYAFYGAGAADRAIDGDDLLELDPSVWGLHAGSYSLAVEPVGSSLLGLFEREAGRRLLTLDPNVRLNVEPNATHWCQRVERFVRLVEVVKVSDEDIDLLYPGEKPADIAEHWRDLGASLVVVTRGADGAEAFTAKDRVQVSAPRVTQIDSVGAGDSFQAALIAALADQGITSRAQLARLDSDTTAGLLKFAGNAAALTCTRRGADLPRRADLTAFEKEAP